MAEKRFWEIDLEKVYPNISLPEEHKRQSLILASRFTESLEMSEEDYIASLPEFPDRPDIYDGLIPVIVETRLPWAKAAALSGIDIEELILDDREISDWTDDGFIMPNIPFSTWAEQGYRFLNQPGFLVRKHLLEDSENKLYRAGRILDSIAIYNARPDWVMQYYNNIVGTSVGLNHIADIGPTYPPELGFEGTHPRIGITSLAIEGVTNYLEKISSEEILKLSKAEAEVTGYDMNSPIILRREIRTK